MVQPHRYELLKREGGGGVAEKVPGERGEARRIESQKGHIRPEKKETLSKRNGQDRNAERDFENQRRARPETGQELREAEGRAKKSLNCIPRQGVMRYPADWGGWHILRYGG